MTTFHPDRLIWARKKAGHTQISLAKLIGVDARAVRAFESGEYAPAQATVRQLTAALGVPQAYFAKGALAGPEVEQASFRSLSKMSAIKRDMALARGAFAFEFADWLSNEFDLPEPDIPDLRTWDNAELAAMDLRARWGLGSKPLGNLVHLLEAKGVRVFSLAVEAREVDAFSTWHDGVPFVFLNTKKTAAHSRFDCAHELAHLVLHRHGDYDGRVSEQEADLFAAAFLMPRDDLIATAPRFPTIDNLLKAKKRWGVSLPALAVRMHKVGMITDWSYRNLFINISKLGLRSREIDDEQRERSKVLEHCLTVLRRDGIGIEGIADRVGLAKEDIVELVFELATIAIDGAGRQSGSVSKPHKLRIVVDNDADG